MIKFIKKWIEDNVPEWVQIAVGLILFLLAPGLLIYFGSHYEWLSSIVFLFIGSAIALTSLRNIISSDFRYGLIFLAVFTFAGTAFDGAGNPVYNKPIEKLCPAETELIREVEFVEGSDYDDNDVYLQRFNCFSKTENKIVEVIPRWKTIFVRCLEYLFLSLIFLGIYWLLSKFQSSNTEKV